MRHRPMQFIHILNIITKDQLFFNFVFVEVFGNRRSLAAFLWSAKALLEPFGNTSANPSSNTSRGYWILYNSK